MQMSDDAGMQIRSNNSMEQQQQRENKKKSVILIETSDNGDGSDNSVAASHKNWN